MQDELRMQYAMQNSETSNSATLKATTLKSGTSLVHKKWL